MQRINNDFDKSIVHYGSVYSPQQKHIFRLSALFISALILKYFSIFVPYLGMQLSLVTVPLIISGVFFGPFVGFLNGIAVDLIAFLLFGNSYSFSFLFTFQTGLYGLISGFAALNISKASNQKEQLKKIWKVVLITTVINSFILGPIFVNLYLQNFQINSKLFENFWLFARLIKETIKIPFTVVLLFFCLQNKDKCWFNQ